MSIVNRRNAVIGWAAWSLAKGVLKKKAKSVQLPGSSSSRSGKKALRVAALVGTAVGGLIVWRKVTHRDSTDHDSIASEELDAIGSEELDADE